MDDVLAIDFYVSKYHKLNALTIMRIIKKNPKA